MNRARQYFFLFLSALLYALPAVLNDYFWLGSFVFVIPLLHVTASHNMTYLQGYFWGICAATLHLFGVLIGIVTLAEGSALQTLLPALLIILYAGLFGLLIPFCFSVVNLFFNVTSSFSTIAILTFAIWFYILCMDHVSLWPFNCMEGYFLMHPLLPLIQYPNLLITLPFFGTEALCALLLITNASIYAVFAYQNWKAYGFALITTVFWLICFFMPIPAEQFPSWLDRILVVPQVFRQQTSVEALAENAAGTLQKITQQHPSADIILMPEAAFYSTELASALFLAYFKHAFSKKIELFTGAFTWQDNLYRNSMYWIENGTIKTVFHKKHAMLLTEKLPSWCKGSMLYELYFKNFNEIIPSENERPLLQIDQQIQLVPYICSELFFANRPTDQFSTKPIYSLCNDRWTVPYVQRLMLQTAQYKAIEWQRTIIYVSFSYQQCIDQFGRLKQLGTTELSL